MNNWRALEQNRINTFFYKNWVSGGFQLTLETTCSIKIDKIFVKFRVEIDVFVQNRINPILAQNQINAKNQYVH